MNTHTTTGQAPHVAVVVLNYQGWQDTLACVASLLREGSGLAMSVIVCDNASPNGSLKHLRQGMSAGLSDGPELLTLSRAQAEAGQGACAPPSTTWQQLVLIDNEGNLGFAAGCNVGIRWACHAGADFVWLLNNDTEVAPNALGALVSHMQASPTMGLCGSKLVYHDDRHCIQARGGAVFDPLTGQGSHLGVGEPIEQPDDVAGIEARMNYVVGASMMARRTFIDRVGLMTEDYFLYYEELDWAERGRALGFGLGYAANSVVYHKEGATIGTSHRRKSSALAMRYLNRNRLLFTHRFYPQHMQAVRRQMWYEVLVYTKHRDWGAVKGLLGALLRTPAARVGAP